MDAVIYIREEERQRSRHKFRQLSRDVCREVFDIPDDNRVLFAYEYNHNKEVHIGQISFQHADRRKEYPGIPFDDDFYNQITFLFVKPDFQYMGVGRDLVKKSIALMKEQCERPIRVQSAQDAVGFFEKLGFGLRSEAIESMCGIRLFRFMYNMELI